MFTTFLLASALLQTPGAQLPATPADVPVPPLHSYEPAPPTRSAIEGAPLLMLEDHRLPLVDGLLIFEAGSLREPADKVGLAEFFAETLRQGGCKESTGDQLNAWLDGHAAELGIESTEDQLRISFNCLSEDAPALLAHIGALLAEPAFEERAVETTRMQMLSAIARAKDDGGALADKAIGELLYGKLSPFGRQPTEDSVASITRADLTAYAKANLGIDRLHLGFSGDFQPEAIEAQLTEALGQLPVLGPAPELPQPTFSSVSRTTIYVVDRPGVPQTELRLAAPGLQTDSEDQPALTLWSYVVGLGGMTNRLMNHVRGDLGLAYGVGCGFSPRMQRPGRLFGYCATRNEAVGEALGAMLETISESVFTRIPNEELEAARRRLLAGHVFQRDSAAELLQRALALEFAGKPADFWERNLERLSSVGSDEIRRAAAAHVPLGHFLVVAVGPADEIVPKLSAVANVVLIEDDQDLPPADEQVAAMLEALGGAQAWAELESLRIDQEVTIDYEQGQIRIPVELSRRLLPLALRLKQITQSGATYTYIITEDEAWQRNPNGVARMPATQALNMRASLQRGIYTSLHRLALDEDSIEAGLDEEGRIVLSDGSGTFAWIQLGPDSRPVAMQTQRTGEERLFHYSDWTDTGGIWYAKRYSEGNQTIDVERFEPNPELPDETFSF